MDPSYPDGNMCSSYITETLGGEMSSELESMALEHLEHEYETSADRRGSAEPERSEHLLLT
jgi:hypothetical protein